MSDQLLPTNVIWAFRFTFLHSEGRVVWLRTMWSSSTRKLEREIQIFCTNFQKYIRFTLKYWLLHEKIRRGKQTDDLTRRMLISSFHLINSTLITPLLNFYLDLGLECDRIYRFVQYTPVKCFNSFVQSPVDARRKNDENPHSSVLAETMKMLVSSSYGYQIMDRSRHTITKYLNDEKTHKAINSKYSKKPNHLNDNLYEIESVKADVEHKEPIIVGFFVLEYATLRILELYYNYFQKFCNFDSFEEMKMDTDSLYLALAHGSLEDCIKTDLREFGTTSEGMTVARPLLQIPATIFFLALVVPNISNMINESLDYLRRNSVALKGSVCAVEPIAASIRAQTSSSSVARSSTKERWRNLELDLWKSTGAYWTRK